MNLLVSWGSLFVSQLDQLLARGCPHCCGRLGMPTSHEGRQLASLPATCAIFSARTA